MIRRALLGALVMLAAAVPARAQLSPGDLSEAHAGLEGSAQCLKCHEPGQGVAAAKCLACHTALGTRIAAGRGLHARAEYRACERCHIEHQGRGFALVHWGKDGRDAFDHAQTGFRLVGRHARLACAQCHAPKNLQDPAALQKGGANPSKTFLGLGTTCTSCHADPHKGQFAPRGCTDCHGQDRWVPVQSFDHDATAFPLTGKHEGVACEKCHAAAAPGAARGTLKFKGVPFASCTSCHRDPHAGRLGAQCTACHSTSGWTRAADARFDHDRTRYPLRGAHRAVACERCHRGPATADVPHARCTDCHGDRHAGQLARAEGGRCEACHDVSGFAPARFGVEDHAKTAWPLEGAHLAVPCDACHREKTAAQLKAAGAIPATSTFAGTTEQLRFPSTQCTACHRDPHAGQTDRAAGAAGCTACHGTPAWRTVGFDHARTAFPLRDAHARVACVRCHPAAQGRIAFTGRPTTCAGCHPDPHQGQLARNGVTDCARCHVARTWAEVQFDHDRDTTFRLEGAHRRVACAGCHRAEEKEGRKVIRFKPVGRACVDCHAPGVRP